MMKKICIDADLADELGVNSAIVYSVIKSLSDESGAVTIAMHKLRSGYLPFFGFDKLKSAIKKLVDNGVISAERESKWNATKRYTILKY